MAPAICNLAHNLLFCCEELLARRCVSNKLSLRCNPLLPKLSPKKKVQNRGTATVHTPIRLTTTNYYYIMFFVS